MLDTSRITPTRSEVHRTTSETVEWPPVHFIRFNIEHWPDLFIGSDGKKFDSIFPDKHFQIPQVFENGEPFVHDVNIGLK